MATDTPAAAALQEELLRRARSRAARPAAAPVSVRQGPAPLSHAQRRMWLMDRLGHGDASYSVPFATRLRGPLDLDALAAALTSLVRRHEILRTRYGQRDGEPYQEVRPARKRSHCASWRRTRTARAHCWPRRRAAPSTSPPVPFRAPWSCGTGSRTTPYC